MLRIENPEIFPPSQDLKFSSFLIKQASIAHLDRVLTGAPKTKRNHLDLLESRI